MYEPSEYYHSRSPFGRGGGIAIQVSSDNLATLRRRTEEAQLVADSVLPPEDNALSGRHGGPYHQHNLCQTVQHRRETTASEGMMNSFVLFCLWLLCSTILHHGWSHSGEASLPVPLPLV